MERGVRVLLGLCFGLDMILESVYLPYPCRKAG